MYTARDSLRRPRALVENPLGRREPWPNEPINDDDDNDNDHNPSGTTAGGGGNTGISQTAPDVQPSFVQASDSAPASGSGLSGSSSTTGDRDSVYIATTNGLTTSDSDSNISPTTTATTLTSVNQGILDSSTTSPTAKHTVTLSSNPSPTSSGHGSGASPDTTDSNISAHHGISKSTMLAVALIHSLVLLGFFLFFLLRRRSIARSAQRRQMWWLNRSTSGSGNSATMPTWNRDSAYRSWTVSTRSSSATVVNERSTPRSTADFEGLVPAFPPMAEIRRGPGSLLIHESGGGPNPPLLSSIDNNSTHNHRGNSTSNTCSIIPNHYAQYPTVQSEQANRTSITNRLPIPTPDHTNPVSTILKAKNPTSSSVASSDSACTNTPKEPQAFPIIPDAPGFSNPFADPSSSPPAPSQVGSQSLETIRCPSVPSLDKEPASSVGDHIKVLETFNSGWALVEKVTTSSDKGLGLAD